MNKKKLLLVALFVFVSLVIIYFKGLLPLQHQPLKDQSNTTETLNGKGTSEGLSIGDDVSKGLEANLEDSQKAERPQHEIDEETEPMDSEGTAWNYPAKE